MTLPGAIEAEIRARVGPVQRVEPIGGGCISATRRVEIAGRPYFLKYDESPPRGFFAAEAEGLERLAAAAPAGLRVPAVVGVGEGEGEGSGSGSGSGWLLLEWVEPVPPSPTADAQLGAALAELHRVRGEAWGWPRDGYIGTLPQKNRSRPGWAEFWWSERIEPQLARAAGAGLGRDAWSALGGRLADLLGPAEADGPSLLHGDLWSGNVLHSATGPALIDPACYHGHREVDLAMAELFGGFGRDFFRAYLDVWPLAQGWELRRRIYQLYYLLVHVNLFGAAYVSRTESTLRSVLADS